MFPSVKLFSVPPISCSQSPDLWELWRSPTACMPERKNFYDFRMGCHSVIQMIMDTGQVKTANTSQLDVSRTRTDQWLGSEYLDRTLQLDRKGIWSFRPVGDPPFGSIENGFASTGDDQDREHTTHDRRICFNKSAALVVFPCSASVIVASSLASSSGESSKVSSPSGASTVTVAPSGRLFGSI